MKTAIKILLGLGALAALVWTGGYYSAHFKILGGLRSMQTQAVPSSKGGFAVPAEPIEEVRDAGCHALPYLIEEIDASKTTAFLVAASALFIELTQGCRCGESGAPSIPPITVDDAAAERQRKIDELKAWWKANGARHRSLRFWTHRCAG
jgi:hypothetical protein